MPIASSPRAHPTRVPAAPLPRSPGLRLPAAIACVLAGLSGSALAQDAQATAAPGSVDASTLDAITVVAQRADRVSNGATNLDLDIKETPQSISVVTTRQIREFGFDDLNDALRLATGIQVEEWETNRTNYLARGFEIKSTQVDGVGMPNDWGIVTGDMDAFGYEKLEVIRGANGLLTGVGNSAGTINYVRKRPTNEAQGIAGIKVGSWNQRRVEADYSTPFSEDGRWAGRAVVAHEEGDSYLRDYRNDRSFVYGVVDGQVGENGTVTFGYSAQRANSDHNMWGALTFSNSDGTQAQWDRSASTTQDWTYWNTDNKAGFVEYTHLLGPDWRLKASYNYRSANEDDQLFFAYTLTGLDPVTGEGLLGSAYKGIGTTDSHLGDIALNGSFRAFGREHEAMFGISLGKSEQVYAYHPVDPGDPSYGALPGFPYPGDAIAEPDWGEYTEATRVNQRLKRAFGATRLALTDRFKAILGVNWAEYRRDGVNYGTQVDQTERNTSPYAGLTFDFNDDILGYIGYSDIYQPQDQTDADNRYLDPSKGVNYEAGIKAEWLDKRLLTTFAVFSAKQEALATFSGYDATTGTYLYEGRDVESEGIELEATGRLSEHTDLVLGYTQLRMDGEDGRDTYRWVPRRTANLALSSRLPSYTPLSFGIGGRWQSTTTAEDLYTGQILRQGSYAVLNAFAAWDVRPNLTLRANVGNLTDEKYIGSLYQVGFYGAPRNYALSLDYRF